MNDRVDTQPSAEAATAALACDIPGASAPRCSVTSAIPFNSFNRFNPFNLSAPVFAATRACPSHSRAAIRAKFAVFFPVFAVIRGDSHQKNIFHGNRENH